MCTEFVSSDKIQIFSFNIMTKFNTSRSYPDKAENCQ